MSKTTMHQNQGQTEAKHAELVDEHPLVGEIERWASKAERHAESHRQRQRALAILAPVLEWEGIDPNDEGALEEIAKKVVEEFDAQATFIAEILPVLEREAIDPESITWPVVAQLIRALAARTDTQAGRMQRLQDEIARLSGVDEQKAFAEAEAETLRESVRRELRPLLERPHRLMSIFGQEAYLALKALYGTAGGCTLYLPAPELDARSEMDGGHA